MLNLLRTTEDKVYLIISFKELMQDHFIDGRSETQISSGQILTDGLKPHRGKALLIIPNIKG